MIFRPFHRWRAAYLYGKALAHFNQRRYRAAARLFEKVSELDDGQEGRHLYYSYLGRTYLLLGDNKQAFKMLSLAYMPFCKRSEELKGDFEKREFLDFLGAFGDVLRRLGQIDRAKEITEQIQRYQLNK